jgi:hypothetical protein
MILDYAKLWEPYSGNGKHTADDFLHWVLKQSAKKGYDKEAAETAVHLTFLELADGKTFNTYRCSCGCDGTNPNTEICHLTLRKVAGLDTEGRAGKSAVYEGHLNAKIVSHMEADNAAYLAEAMPPEPEPIQLDDEIKPEPQPKSLWSKLWSPYR